VSAKRSTTGWTERRPGPPCSASSEVVMTRD
jgi:hypothetical protein